MRKLTKQQKDERLKQIIKEDVYGLLDMTEEQEKEYLKQIETEKMLKEIVKSDKYNLLELDEKTKEYWINK